MPTGVHALLSGRNEQIDYRAVIDNHPWIVSPNQHCILSPDSDGLMCGLLMSHLFGWKISGFYDGKIALIFKDLSARDCIFLDMDIYRGEIKSFGHHMLQYNKDKKPSAWNNFNNCIQPNNMRNFDKKHDFRLKYPLGTIHMLIGIVSQRITVPIPTTAICPLLFVDGTYQNLFGYPENVLNWLNYLRANESSNPLKLVFEDDNYSVFSLMKAMDDFFRKRDTISITHERGDRLKVSSASGDPLNLEDNNGFYNISIDAKNRVERFVSILSELTTWPYDSTKWAWGDFKLHKFKKGSKGNDKKPVSFKDFNEVMSLNPLSWAIRSTNVMEYAIEDPDKLFI